MVMARHLTQLEAFRRVGIAMALWGGCVAVAAAAGLYAALPPMALAPLAVAGIVLPNLAYQCMPAVRATMRAVGVRALTGFHMWRIAAAPAFLWYGAHDLLPPSFAYAAAWGDALAGVFAALVVALPFSRARYTALHLFGMADFINALVGGVGLTLAHDPRMQALRVLPMVMIPLFGVGVSGAAHVMALDMLWRRREVVLF